MKRILIGLIVASAMAIASAPNARAAAPGECGKSYAMLINGTEPSTVSADGSATLPGALTQIVGVGEISFGPATANPNTCDFITGELIYDDGDFQTNPSAEFFAPAGCYLGKAPPLNGTGVIPTD